MARAVSRFFMTLFLVQALFGAAFVAELSVEEAMGVAPVAYAQGPIGGIEQKVNDVAEMIRRILYIFAGLGVLFVGFKFVQGDPHAWRYAMFVVVGSAIIFGSEQILSWLRT